MPSKSDELSIAVHFRDWKEPFPRKWLAQVIKQLGSKCARTHYGESSLGSDDRMVVITQPKFKDDVHKLVQKYQTDMVELLGDEQVHSFKSVKELESAITSAVKDAEESARLDHEENEELKLLVQSKKLPKINYDALMEKYGIKSFHIVEMIKLTKLYKLDSRRRFSRFSLANHLVLKEYKETIKNRNLKHKPADDSQAIESDVDLS